MIRQTWILITSESTFHTSLSFSSLIVLSWGILKSFSYNYAIFTPLPPLPPITGHLFPRDHGLNKLASIILVNVSTQVKFYPAKCFWEENFQRFSSISPCKNILPKLLFKQILIYTVCYKVRYIFYVKIRPTIAAPHRGS